MTKAQLLTPEEIKEKFPVVYKVLFDPEIDTKQYLKDCKEDGKVNVFVYGTLKRGESNHSVMEKAEGVFQKEVSVKGIAIVNTPWYPLAFKFASDDMDAQGELYTVPFNKLDVLDTLEGYPHLYDRIAIETTSGEKAIVYTYNDEDQIKSYMVKYGLIRSWKGNHA